MATGSWRSPSARRPRPSPTRWTAEDLSLHRAIWGRHRHRRRRGQGDRDSDLRPPRAGSGAGGAPRLSRLTADPARLPAPSRWTATGLPTSPARRGGGAEIARAYIERDRGSGHARRGPYRFRNDDRQGRLCPRLRPRPGPPLGHARPCRHAAADLLGAFDESGRRALEARRIWRIAGAAESNCTPSRPALDDIPALGIGGGRGHGSDPTGRPARSSLRDGRGDAEGTPAKRRIRALLTSLQSGRLMAMAELKSGRRRSNTSARVFDGPPDLTEFPRCRCQQRRNRSSGHLQTAGDTRFRRKCRWSWSGAHHRHRPLKENAPQDNPASRACQAGFAAAAASRPVSGRGRGPLRGLIDKLGLRRIERLRPVCELKFRGETPGHYRAFRPRTEISRVPSYERRYRFAGPAAAEPKDGCSNVGNPIVKILSGAGARSCLETSEIARQADGAVLATYGGPPWCRTVVVVRRRSPPGVDFFPLTVITRSAPSPRVRFPAASSAKAARPKGNAGLAPDRPSDPPALPEGYQNDAGHLPRSQPRPTGIPIRTSSRWSPPRPPSRSGRALHGPDRRRARRPDRRPATC